jgi:hypothetical protein
VPTPDTSTYKHVSSVNNRCTLRRIPNESIYALSVGNFDTCDIVSVKLDGSGLGRSASHTVDLQDGAYSIACRSCLCRARRQRLCRIRQVPSRRKNHVGLFNASRLRNPRLWVKGRMGYQSAVTLGARTICHAILYAAAKQATHHSTLGYL